MAEWRWPLADRAACADAINECRFIDMDAAPLLRLLGDETRLRLLRLLAQEPLNVSELTAVLGLAQSGVSRHLALLRDAGLVAEDRDGGYAWYRLADAASHNGQAPLWAWLHEQFERATSASPSRAATATSAASSCPGAAGRPGRGRSDSCCRRSTSPISAAARATSRSRPRGGRSV
jgi:DNA-binding transcriptional ArsR family regulator